MKKVRTSIAMFGYPSCSILELPDEDAASLISGGFAEPSSEPADGVVAQAQAEPEPEPVLETADAPAGDETADAPTPAPRKAPARKRKPSSS